MSLALAVLLTLTAVLAGAVIPQLCAPIGLILAVLVAIRGWRRESLFGGFFVLGAIHVLVGFATALPSEMNTGMSSTHNSDYYSLSFLTISLGLFVSCVVFEHLATPATRLDWLTDVSEHRLQFVAVSLLGAASLLMFWTFYRLGAVGFLLSATNIGEARYLGGVSDSYRRDYWVISRALDVLTYVLPAVLLLRSGLSRSQRWFVIPVSIIALALPLRRASILSVVLTWLVAKGVTRKQFGIAILVLVSLYSASQIALLTDAGDHAATSIASGLPEVRDLGWVMSLMGDTRYRGATFLQPFVPIPAFLSDWKYKNSMGYLTAELIGVDPDAAEFGGLRLTLAGEAYMNFGIVGVPLVALVFGVICAKCNALLQTASTIVQRYVAATCFSGCFWLYMGGTQAMGTIKGAITILVVMLWLSRSMRHPANALPHTAPANP
jgi:hypothetical protein